MRVSSIGVAWEDAVTKYLEEITCEITNVL